MLTLWQDAVTAPPMVIDSVVSVIGPAPPLFSAPASVNPPVAVSVIVMPPVPGDVRLPAVSGALSVKLNVPTLPDTLPKLLLVLSAVKAAPWIVRPPVPLITPAHVPDA